MAARDRVDTAVEVETPEGIELELRPAGVVPRGLAWLLDLLIRISICIVLAIVLGMLSGFGMALLLIIVFFIEWLYPVIGEVWFDGTTPGKRALRIRVVRDDGAPVGIQASMIRNLLRAVDFLPFANAFGVISMVLSQRFQRLGDLAAGTLVVYDARSTSAQLNTGTAPAPPPYTLDIAEQQLLLDYADRSHTLSESRQHELASCAGALVANSNEPAQRLRAYAAWLGGDSGGPANGP